MKTIDLKNKKIGIWGLGIVGSSVLEYIKQFTNHIQILDSKSHATINVIVQTPATIKKFLDDNDIIIPSPGIPLHPYQKKYSNKFVCELDIFSSQIAQNIAPLKTIAITGTVGKTSITHILQQCICNCVAAGNIGYAMLNVCNLQPQPEIVVLELSSYQLHYTKHFAPDMAIWTNFFPNHLDHHTTKKEYFWAKCNIIKHQTEKHIALLPYSLIETIKKHIIMSCKVYLFVSYKPRKKLIYPTFYIHKNNAVLDNGSTKIIIFKNIHQLPDVTFPENWLIIIASLYLQKISFDQLNTMARTLQDQHHRVEFVRNFNGVSIYNDSKSTVWQSTHKALQRFKDKKIALFLGGLSKGTNRAPLIQSLAQQNVTVFAFGKEAALLSSLCEKFQVQCYVSTTLQQALEKYLSLQNNFEILLFSPAGSSFDLFKNYIDRGNQFKNMIMKL